MGKLGVSDRLPLNPQLCRSFPPQKKYQSSCTITLASFFGSSLLTLSSRVTSSCCSFASKSFTFSNHCPSAQTFVLQPFNLNFRRPQFSSPYITREGRSLKLIPQVFTTFENPSTSRHTIVARFAPPPAYYGLGRADRNAVLERTDTQRVAHPFAPQSVPICRWKMKNTPTIQ